METAGGQFVEFLEGIIQRRLRFSKRGRDLAEMLSMSWRMTKTELAEAGAHRSNMDNNDGLAAGRPGGFQSVSTAITVPLPAARTSKVGLSAMPLFLNFGVERSTHFPPPVHASGCFPLAPKPAQSLETLSNDGAPCCLNWIRIYGT